MRVLRESRAGRGDRLAWELGTPLSERGAARRGPREMWGHQPRTGETVPGLLAGPITHAGGTPPPPGNAETCQGHMAQGSHVLLPPLGAGRFQQLPRDRLIHRARCPQ